MPCEIRSEILDEADKVACDGNGEYQRHGDPERTIQVRIWSDLIVKVVLIEGWCHGACQLCEDFGCIDVKVLLVVFDLPY